MNNGKGKKIGDKSQRMNAETAQNDDIQRLERQFQTNATQRAIREKQYRLVKHVEKQCRSLHLLDGIENFVYKLVYSLPQFSVLELVNAMNDDCFFKLRNQTAKMNIFKTVTVMRIIPNFLCTNFFFV